MKFKVGDRVSGCDLTGTIAGVKPGVFYIQFDDEKRASRLFGAFDEENGKRLYPFSLETRWEVIGHVDNCIFTMPDTRDYLNSLNGLDSLLRAS